MRKLARHHPSEAAISGGGGAGGVVFADGGYVRGAKYDAATRATVANALMEAGQRVPRGDALSPIPNGHPLYHCFFDFPDGPPMGNDYLNIISPSAGEGWEPYPYLHGIDIDNRLLAIHSIKAYTVAWSDWGKRNAYDSGYSKMDPTRQLQFGVNSIIFALTQEGSITHRLMASVR